ncbi:MAG: hypothetical protein ACI4P6_08470 [Candidatus Spyradosoma sp.]
MSCASYGYNSRGEVISVIAENDPAYNFAYTFDVIGNRISSQENTATQTVVECGYDSQGRRIEKRVTVAGTVVLHERYVYDGYLQIAAFDVSTDASGTEFSSLKRSVLWDPAEATATRPLAVKNVDESGNTALRYRFPLCVIMTMGLKISKTFCRIFQRSS